ncbi:hypothetical protein [Pseudomonas fluorescens]|uniref:hypothetical protein n=1 Tax=Pseudomonas fluorescens TaxID=294 RepID=UPI0012D3F0A6|nr:hypothetical protein [Pseudomonas fluorescens]
MQDLGRGRGNRALPPKLQAEDTYYLDVESGYAIEAELTAKFELRILPQIVLDLPAINVTSSDYKSLDLFLEKFKSLLKLDEFSFVEKDSGPSSAVFRVSRVVRDGNSFMITGTSLLAKPPKNTIWLRRSEGDVGHYSDGRKYNFHSRFYLHDSKSINYKSCDIAMVLSDLQAVYNFLNQEVQLPRRQVETVSQPSIKVGMSFSYTMTERALAKIGFNFLIKIMGANYARDEAFSSIKSSILNGTPELPPSKLPNDDLHLFLGTPPKDHHALFLYAVPYGDGSRAMIVFVLKLYGGEASCFFLSYDAPAPGWTLPIYFLVDYQQHKITQVQSMEYIRNYCRALIESSPLANLPSFRL